MPKNNSKKPDQSVVTTFSFLSAIFFLVFLDVVFLHPFANLAALVLLAMLFYRVGRDGR